MFTSSLFATNRVFILVHGTWGADSNWHQPQGEFYQALLKQNIKPISFKWSGVLSYQKRQLASKRLASLISSYPSNTKFILITHSHGGNVGILASQLLNQPGQIEHFYALGTPVDNDCYLPDMQVIKSFYNLFSFGDTYQTALGFHQRVFPAIANIYNINLEIDNKKPQHEALHCPTMAKWLPQLHYFIRPFNSSKPLFAKFHNNQKPVIATDLDFKHKLERDLLLHEMFCLHLLGNYFDGRRF